MADLLNFINNLLWDSLLIYLLLGTGIWFTLRTGFIQIRHFCHTFTILKDSGTRGDGGISPFQALCTSLATRIGCGNLMGVAIALILGGTGAIFWMWLAALIGMATAFAESTLAQLYKIRDTCGGPAWYMANGLGLRWMGTLFTLFLLAGYGGFFSAVQANPITLSAQQLSGMDRWPITLALLILCAAAIFGGLRAIARLTQWLVPAMGLPAAASGLVGYGLAQAIFQGVQRGLFSNEAGTGSAPNIAAAAAPWPPHPASQGYIHMLAVFIDTLVICSATAAIILTSGTLEHAHADIHGIALIYQSLATVTGHWSMPLLMALVFVFSFAAIIGNYTYAESSLRFFVPQPVKLKWLLRLLTLTMVLFGCVAEVSVVWRLADLAMGLMTITNLIALLLLSPVVLMLANDYNSQRAIGKLPTFYAANFPAIAPQLAPGLWVRPATPRDKNSRAAAPLSRDG
ncbi:alanine-sodium transport protein [Candidatus Sodalis pierantonius str. SOPE]|uniref:Alanine-sodium transport protein n=1 Tax=Candidatus Sodalis pierantonii str. SOPE TaxID=2342 RepID=W0HIJ5_9GAMM|nr:alanine:cation symporter family protein [Candidatus Sodalis pierantonius]AHF73611.1 alanine-sodium transport protein [Candidatus Sodalis pierantonius str. SOPE]